MYTIVVAEHEICTEQWLILQSPKKNPTLFF